VVDADEGGDVSPKFFAEPLSETTARSIPRGAGRWENCVGSLEPSAMNTRSPLQLESAVSAPE